jgi:ESAT-6 family protein
LANITVQTEQLHAVSRQITAGAHQIEQTLGQLHAQVAPLRTEWKGHAQAQFEQLWAEWNRSAAGIHHALTGIAQLMASAGTQFGDKDTEIAGTFRSAL